MPTRENSSQEMQSLLDESEEEKSGCSNLASSDYINTLKGIAAGFACVICNALSAICVQGLEREIPDFELNTIRSIFPLLFLIAGLLWLRKWPSIPRTEILGASAFCINGFILNISLYISLTLLPVSAVQCISVAVNIISGVILFAMILKEKITWFTICMTAMCIVGVTMVIQPDWTSSGTSSDFSMMPNNNSLDMSYKNFKGDIYTNQSYPNNKGDVANQNYPTYDKLYQVMTNLTEQNQSNPEEPETKYAGLLATVMKIALPIVTGITMSMDVLILKLKPFLGEHIIDLLLLNYVASIILSLLLSLIIEQPVIPGDIKSSLLAVSHGILHTVIWPLYIYSIYYISGNTFNIIFSTTTVFLLIAQYTILASILPGHQNWIEVVGVAMVTLASVFGSILELLRSKSQDTQ